MNVNELLAAASNVKLIHGGMYDGLPVRETNRDLLAAVAKLKAHIGDSEFNDQSLQAWDVMVEATATKPDKGQNGKGAEKLKWAAFPSEVVTDSNGNKYNMPKLSDDAQVLYSAFREANVAAAKARAEFEQLGLPEIKAALVKAAGKPLPAGKGVLVTYKFGRVNVAVADADEVAKTSAKSLGDLY